MSAETITTTSDALRAANFKLSAASATQPPTLAPQPSLVQAAGHGLLRLSESRAAAVVKPTTANEALFYSFIVSDPSFTPVRRFLPHHYGTAPLAEHDPAHPTHTHEIEIENLCLLDRLAEVPRSSDEDGTTDAETAPSSLVETPMLNAGRSLTRSPQPASDEAFAEESTPNAPPVDDLSSTAKASGVGLLPAPMKSPRDLVGQDAHSPHGLGNRTQWSAPSVLDMKLGRIRHGPTTRPEKVAHIKTKDAGTTGPDLGVRLCGLRHERRVLEDVDGDAAAAQREARRAKEAASPFNDPLSREDSMAAIAAQDDRPSDEEEDEACESSTHHSALRYYDTMQSRRPEPSPAVPVDASQRRRRRRRVVLGRRHEWVEGKSLGRRADRECLVEALARFCTCVELQSVAGQGADGSGPCTGSFTQLCVTGGHFKPQPHLPLVRHYRDEALGLLAALDASEVLARYSFVSSSAILVHDFHVKVPTGATAAAVAGTAFDEELIAYRAQLRVVDFSSSGALKDGTVFSDSEVGFRDGVCSLVDLLGTVLERYGGGRA
jgi:hypothetical protein